MWFENLEVCGLRTWRMWFGEPGSMWFGNLELCGLGTWRYVVYMGAWRYVIWERGYGNLGYLSFNKFTPCNNVALPLGHCPPHFFSLQCETGRNGCGCMQRLFCGSHPVGEELHGCVFPPINRTAGHKYPTVHFVYGGPHFQVRSGLSGLI